MPRLPKPGSDENTWGDILNEFLTVAHNDNGSLKDVGVVAQKYVKPAGGIPEADLATAVQTKLNSGASVSDADATTKGIVRLTGDLGGTADNPMVPGLADKADAATLSSHTNSTTNVHGIADTSALVSGSGVTNIVVLTQAAYDELTPDDNTLYVVVG